MQYKEIIHICPLNNGCRKGALDKAMELNLSCDKTANHIDVLTHKDRDGDILIILHTVPEAESGELSMQGLLLADCFSRFGWVYHAIWTRI